VRTAQARLATFFLLRNDYRHTRAIQEDMAGEPMEFLASVCEELKSEESAEYWEVTDREENFSWLPPERRARLDEFFAFFDVEAAAR
jgi:hypothetical protein